MNSSGAGPGNIGSSSNAAGPATTTTTGSSTRSSTVTDPTGRQPTSMRFNLTVNELSPSNNNSETNPAVAATAAEVLSGAAAAVTSSRGPTLDQIRAGRRGVPSGTAPSYLGKRRRKRSSQHSSPRTSPFPERQVPGRTHVHSPATALNMSTGTISQAESGVGVMTATPCQHHSQPYYRTAIETGSASRLYCVHCLPLREGKTDSGRYALLSSNLSRNQAPPHQHASSNHSSSNNNNNNNNNNNRSAQATSYLPQEPRSPITPTSAAAGNARSRASTLQSRPLDTQDSDVRSSLHPSDAALELGETMSDQIQSSTGAPEVQRHWHGAVATADGDLTRPTCGRVLPGRGTMDQAADRKWTASSNRTGPAARLVRSVVVATPSDSKNSDKSETAEQGSANVREPFMLQPVPPARKRRKVVKGITEVISGDQMQGVNSVVKSLQSDVADRDVQMITAPQQDPALCEVALNEEPQALCDSAATVDLPTRPVTQSGPLARQDGTQMICAQQIEKSPSVPQLSVAVHGVTGGHDKVAFTSTQLSLQNQASEIRRTHRLGNRRALSLPNLSAWPTLEISNPARHSHFLPDCLNRNGPFLMGVGVPAFLRGGPLHPDVQMENVGAQHHRFLMPGSHLRAEKVHGDSGDGSFGYRFAMGQRTPGSVEAASPSAVGSSPAQSSSCGEASQARHVGQPSASRGGEQRSAAHQSTRWTPVVPAPVRTDSHIIQPSLYPSITRQTLHELEMTEMSKNPQLRHDVVFDPHVQFRPNFEGERGRKIRESADQYWAAVAREIADGCTCLRFENGEPLSCVCPPTMLRKSASAETNGSAQVQVKQGPFISWPARIPILVHELRAILISILPTASAFVAQISSSPQVWAHVPSAGSGSNTNASGSGASQARAGPSSLASGFSAIPTVVHSSVSNMTQQRMISHRDLVLQMLDPALITQQIKHGVLNLEAMIRFLAKVLKMHCAPMRDELVEGMVNVVCQQGDIVRGLRMCFEILELMKLDIANHQLRTNRPKLVETAVDFEVHWFREQIAQGKLTLDRTSRWFTSALRLTREKLSAKLNVDTAMSRKDFISRAFNQGFLQLLFEAPVALPFAELVAIRKAGMASGIAPSSSSLNQAYTACYPETFQFDAYRLIGFHNDITDLSVVYMFLLLFRQLACSPLEIAEAGKGSGRTTFSGARQASPAAIRAQAALLASNELDNMKNRIWCLLNEANAKVGAQNKLGGFNPRASARPGGAQDTSGTNGRAGAGLVYGSIKFENAVWREGVNDVLLQVAAQASAVQKAAKHAANVMLRVQSKAKEDDIEMDLEEEDDDDDDSMEEEDDLDGIQYDSASTPPSERVLAMLNSWMDTNLRVNSPLHKLCQSRLREVVLAILVDRLAGSPPASTATAVAAATAAVRRKQEVRERALKVSTAGAAAAATASAGGVRRAGGAAGEDGHGNPSKRLKVGHCTSSSTSTSTSSVSTPTSSSSTLHSPSDSPTLSTACSTDFGGSASSGHSLAQQQAISLHRLLKAQKQGDGGSTASSSASTTPTSSTPQTPLSLASTSSVPMTPVPRSPLWTTSTPEERDWPSALTRSGLEPFAAEVRLLGDRISTLAAFHLRVFRNLYERLDLADPSTASI
ncbi:hypothetical protein CF326_g408 [Tilletia indica]|nr:hypothetical protein CF326_g408 [Tilletia indica]